MYTYVDSVNSNLICCICRMPYTDPYTTRTCQHTFCKDCITHSISYHSSQCPIDRLPLNTRDLLPADPIVRSLVDELIVECPHRGEGCTHKSQRQSIAIHLLDDCPYKHGFAPLEAAQDQSSYDEDDTDARISDSTGSVSKATQTDSETASTDFSDSRSAALSEQNILLRHRVELLDSNMSVMKREMAAIRRALGPWFRAAEGSGMGRREEAHQSFASPNLPTSRMASIPTSRQSEIASGSVPPEDIEVALWNPLESPVMTPNRPEEDPAGLLDAPYQQTYGFGVVHNRPDVLLHQRRYSVGATRSESRPAQADAIVAPLNLNTSLEGTLAGLRESLVGLASTVDSMGRRHEMSLAHEGMRVSEEVGGLRAAIHGLRMQIHSIMMDRNAQVTGRPPMFNGVLTSSGPSGDGNGGGPRLGTQVKL